MHAVDEIAWQCDTEEKQAREWDNSKWLRSFLDRTGMDEAGMHARRKECRKLIWEQTRALVESGRYARANELVESYKVRAIGKRMYPRKEDEQEVGSGPYVINEDILSCAERLCENGEKVAVINMACDSRPGGGVHWGAGAQEENLYRRTDMCARIQEFRELHYPLQGAALVTRNVTLLRGREEDGYPFIRRGWQVTVVSCAAPRNPRLKKSGGYMDEPVAQQMRQSIRNLLTAFHYADCDTVLLSAFGCGAYQNPPDGVARLFREELGRISLKRVVFCIKEDHNTGYAWNLSGNLEPFKTRFPERCCEQSWHGWYCSVCDNWIPKSCET